MTNLEPLKLSQEIREDASTVTLPDEYFQSLPAKSGLFAVYHFNQPSGSTTTPDLSGNNYDVTNQNVEMGNFDPGNGLRLARWDGAATGPESFHVPSPSSTFFTQINMNEFAQHIVFKVQDLATYTDGILRYVNRIYGDGSNFLEILKSTVNNRLQFSIRYAGVDQSDLTFEDWEAVWHRILIKVSGGQLKIWINGVQFVHRTGLGAWGAASLHTALTNIGSNNHTTNANPFKGDIARMAIWKDILPTDQQCQDLTNIIEDNFFDNSKYVVLTDIHIGTGRMLRPKAYRMVRRVNRFETPKGVLNLGDNGHNYGVGFDYQLYHDIVYVPFVAARPFTDIVGNHDGDYDVLLGPDPLTYTTYQAIPAFVNEPTNKVIDWDEPKVRFILLHCDIQINGTYNSFFGCTAANVSWFDTQLTNLPAGWKAIIGTHGPFATAFGNYIHPAINNGLNAIAASHASKILVWMSGHRHQDGNTATQDGILCFNTPSAWYNGGGGGIGGYIVLDYDGPGNQITIKYFLNQNPWTELSPITSPAYTPVVLSL